MQVRARQGGFVRTEGGLLPADLLERVRALDRRLPGLDEASYDLERGERFGEATNRAWNRLVGAWATFQDELANLPVSDPATTTTRERFLLPLMEELGYGRLSPTKAIELDGKAYPISHGWEDVITLHLVGANVPLDRRTQRVAGAAGQSPHGLLQELLNRSPDRLWGLVSNGRTLRILRDNASLTRQAYVEFDLEAIMTGESYADFALLWHLAHRSRLEPRLADGAEEGSAPTVHGCYLERWSKVAEETGARARDHLRDGVQEAIEALGSGFLHHSANAELKAALQSGELATQDFYRELLRLVYRLILLFVAEDRDLLLDPTADPATRERYTRFYSTARLRRLAERRKGSRHADLYAGLRVVIDALGRDVGAPGLGLPPLGGFLFGPDACPHLDAAQLANADVLDAVRKLATIEVNKVRRSVDYANMGSEELGSIYESLLERHPEVDIPSASFKLEVAAGHERKTTGSYYTPSSLIGVLLDSALDPVLEEKVVSATTKEDQEQAILEMSVVDPAAGSGHFLVAAAHRIAKRLAQVRTADEEPAPDAIRTALRDVIGHCLYAVDINPMAVELCKVSLWLEALEPGKPLTFLDAHIKCGNSLLGTTPELIAQGIPDAAYDPIEGDDKEVAKALKKRNRQEREGQLALGESELGSRAARLAAAMISLDASPAIDMTDVTSKQSIYGAMLASADYLALKATADAWTGAFFVRKSDGRPPITTATVRALSDGAETPAADFGGEISSMATAQGFFHWFVEFPVASGRGGFDVVVGNPPWEKVQVEAVQFFATRSPSIVGARNQAQRNRMIAELATVDAPLWEAYVEAVRASAGESQFARASGSYPLTGRGRVNTYALFAERALGILGSYGRVGIIVPTGIATDDSTKEFFSRIVADKQLASFHAFENESFVFPTVHHAFRFGLLTVAGSSAPHPVSDFVFFARRVADLAEPWRHFGLTDEDIRLLNPNTGNCPVFRSSADADLAKDVYRRIPVFVDRTRPAGNPWGIAFAQGLFNMASDSGRFHELPSATRVPLYESKLFHQYNHRWGTYDGGDVRSVDDDLLRDTDFTVRPRYWVDLADVQSALSDKPTRRWLLAWRSVTGVEKVRTVIASALPEVGVGHNALLGFSSRAEFPLLIANLNSFAFDWQARQKVGGIHLAFFVIEQLPVLPPQHWGAAATWADVTVAEWVRPYLIELVFTAKELTPFARDLGWMGGPFVWDRHRRAQLQAELDAAFFHLYGIPRESVDRVMESFWIVRERDHRDHGTYRTKELILDAYDAMAVASPARPFVTRLDPVPGDARVAHPPRAGEHNGRWVPWTEVVAGSVGHDASPRSRSTAPTDPPNNLRHSRADHDVGASQLNLASLQAEPDGWSLEGAVDPRRIRRGSLVRHRSFGQGTVVDVRDSGRTATFVISFPSGEREISFGYGMLEFRLQG